MPNYLHRTTKIYQTSVSPMALSEPAANYIQDPDLSAVEGFASWYWTITGDIVSLMSVVERAAVDAQAVETRRDSAMGQLDDLEELFRAYVKTAMSENNLLRVELGLPPRTFAQLRTAIRGELGS